MEKIRLDLQLFGEGGGGAAGGDGAGEGTAPAEGQEGKAGKGDLSEVKYGKQAEEPQQQPEADEEPKEAPKKEPTPKKTFDQLLKEDEEYQKEMQRRIDQAINRRFAKSKAAEEQSAKLAPVRGLWSISVFRILTKNLRVFGILMVYRTASSVVSSLRVTSSLFSSVCPTRAIRPRSSMVKWTSSPSPRVR